MPSPASYQAFDSCVLDTVPSASAGYDGTGASKFCDAPGAGETNDVAITLTATAEVTDSNIVRIFKKTGGVLVPKIQVKLERVPLDPNTLSQLNRPIGMIRLNGTDEIWASQEENDDLILDGEISKYQP